MSSLERCQCEISLTSWNSRNLHNTVGFFVHVNRTSIWQNRESEILIYTSHTARDSMAAVRNLFPNHVISRYGDITWPARSPGLSACDFFLWGVSKISSLQSSSTPHSSGVWKHRIKQEVKWILVEMPQRVMGDVRKRLAECLERNGGHLNDVIFGKWDFCFHCVKLLNGVNWN